MNNQLRNKKKIINDPVFGFIHIPSETLYDLIEHPWFQRLRRVKQLGLSFLVYPGANHTRFEHALGAMHLMSKAIAGLKLKGIDISDEETEATLIAILLHDIGHAPFSHVLENTLVSIGHEEVSLLLMKKLDEEFKGKLTLAIDIFTNTYKKKFLHQLVSSQLDVDRLDYLSRDSFFTGVAEGVVGIDRIIAMFNVKDDELVVEAKGIYSVEKFLIARRLMYWQVYLHKTVVSAEYLMINVLNRAKEFIRAGNELFATPALAIFLKQDYGKEDFETGTPVHGKTLIEWFNLLDDNDILISIKAWQSHSDRVLSFLSQSITNRKLFKSALKSKPVPHETIEKIKDEIEKQFGAEGEIPRWFFIYKDIENYAYSEQDEKINVLYGNGKIREIGKASDINLSALTKAVRKYFISFPKELVNYDL